MEDSLALQFLRLRRVSQLSERSRFISTISESSCQSEALIPATQAIQKILISQFIQDSKSDDLMRFYHQSKIKQLLAVKINSQYLALTTLMSDNFNIKIMSSPNRYRAGSPVRTLEQRFYSKPLEVILEENNVSKLSNSLIYQNKALEKENERLIYEVARSKDGQTQNYTDNLKLKKEREKIEYELRSLEAAAAARDEAKERQLQSQERDIRLLRNQYERENQALNGQILSLTNKISLIEASKNQQLEDLKQKCLTVTSGETQFIKKNLGEELRKVVGELELTKYLLSEKERQSQHLVILSQQASAEYTHNLQSLISENNVLRNQLIALELQKNKQIHEADSKKELQKSRTIGILSFCKENSHFMEKELTRLAEQLLEKNISIETFTKELLKQRKHAESSEKKFEETVNKLKFDFESQLRESEKQIQKLEKNHRQDITEFKKRQIDLQEQVASRLNDLDNAQREINHIKEQISVKDKEIEELKDNISRMHEDHSKDLSKVMLDSRVKRRSGMNISSYSSSSLKDIQDAQGSSIIKVQSLDRKNSSNEALTPSGLPVVKEQLAVSHGHIDQEEQDIQIKELILHYESMIEELKRNKADELSIASRKIEGLKFNLEQKQQELIEMLNRFTPLMELKINRPSLEEERRAKIQQSQRGDIAILEVLLEKYGIVSLRPKNR